MKWNSNPLVKERAKLLQEGAILAVFLLVCVAFILFAIEGSSRRTSEFISISLHTDRLADYGVDTRTTPIPIIGLNLIEDFLRDQDPRATGVIERVETVQAGLLTPVPTVTPYSSAGNPPTESIPTPTSTSPSTTDDTPEPAATVTPIGSLTHTSTPVLSLTSTSTPVGTLMASATTTHTPEQNDSTATPNPATPTSLPTSTPTSGSTLPVATTVPPTNTPQPTNTSLPTNTPLPTDTLIPTNTPLPTATPTATKPTPTTIPAITATPTP